VTPLLGPRAAPLRRGSVRRLRLRGLIERVPHSRRYRVTPLGFRTALFVQRAYARLLPNMRNRGILDRRCDHGRGSRRVGLRAVSAARRR
jgi:hypothetical protein